MKIGKFELDQQTTFWLIIGILVLIGYMTGACDNDKVKIERERTKQMQLSQTTAHQLLTPEQ